MPEPSHPADGRENVVGGRNGRTEAWTVRRLLTWTTQYFADAGLHTPRLDAELLLAHAMGQDRLGLYLNHDAPVSEDALRTYRGLVRRRRRFEPVAYLTGTREFFSIPFSVSRSVLIPRPETEHLVEVALGLLRARQTFAGAMTLRVLDIGTGSGNIAAALAHHIPEARIVAADLSREALEVAAGNLRALSLPPHGVVLVQGDLLSWLRPASARFDLIVSNPPYISSEAWEALPRDVRDHEPRTALLGGASGMEIQERILESAFLFLQTGGSLLLEIGAGQAEHLQEFACSLGAYEAVRLLPDYAGIPRVLAARRCGLTS